MKYKVIESKTRFGEIIDSAVTDKGIMRVVKNHYGAGFRIRRIQNEKDEWTLDLSKDYYNTLKDAESALLSGCVEFGIGK